MTSSQPPDGRRPSLAQAAAARTALILHYQPRGRICATPPDSLAREAFDALAASRLALFAARQFCRWPSRSA
ncbi:hypothetical protein LAC76_24830 [Escherichia coli]|nr:hypothetical protein [Escherichia coli]MCX9743318.1 hypothetical protein [Escherichia coli]